MPDLVWLRLGRGGTGKSFYGRGDSCRPSTKECQSNSPLFPGVKEGRAKLLKVALEPQDKQDRLWEKVELLETEIRQQQKKIEAAIEAEKPPALIECYQQEKARLEESLLFWRQQASALQTQLSGTPGALRPAKA